LRKKRVVMNGLVLSCFLLKKIEEMCKKTKRKCRSVGDGCPPQSLSNERAEGIKAEKADGQKKKKKQG
jgi:hypothetical protein